MNQKTTYNRAKHSSTVPYLKLSSKLIADKRLNATAIGLMCLILNNADSFVISRKDIQKRSNLNSNQFKVTWKLLMDANYIEAIYKGNHKWEYIINEEDKKQEVTGDSLKDKYKDGIMERDIVINDSEQKQEVTGNSLQEVTGNLYNYNQYNYSSPLRSEEIEKTSFSIYPDQSRFFKTSLKEDKGKVEGESLLKTFTNSESDVDKILYEEIVSDLSDDNLQIDIVSDEDFLIES